MTELGMKTSPIDSCFMGINSSKIWAVFCRISSSIMSRSILIISIHQDEKGKPTIMLLVVFFQGLPTPWHPVIYLNIQLDD